METLPVKGCPVVIIEPVYPVESDDIIHATDTGYDTHSNLTRSEEIFYKRLLELDIDLIEPVIVDDKIEYPVLSDLLTYYAISDILRLLESLIQKNWIQERKNETLISCPSCNSFSILIKGHCVNCHSPNISRDIIIEHKLCGYKGYVRSFRKEVDEVCPKCKRRVTAEEVRILGSVFECSNCKSKFEHPVQRYSCNHCSSEFEAKQANYTPLKSYSVTILQEKAPKKLRPRVKTIEHQPIKETQEPDDTVETPLIPILKLRTPNKRTQSKTRLSLPFDLKDDEIIEEPVKDEPTISVVPTPSKYKPKKKRYLLGGDKKPNKDRNKKTPENPQFDTNKSVKPKDTGRKVQKVIIYSEDHLAVESIFKVVSAKIHDRNVKIQHYLDLRQLFRGLGNDCDLLVLDMEHAEDVDGIFKELEQWDINCPIIVIGNAQKFKLNVHLYKNNIKDVIKKDKKAYEKIAVFLLNKDID